MSGLAIYPRILGNEWSAVPEPVRRCHEASPLLVAKGRFVVTHAPGWLARIAIFFARMPDAGEDIALRLEVRALDDHQVWTRSFGAAFTMVTHQRLLPSGHMAERRGPIEMLFRMVRDGDALVYQRDGLRLCLGRLRIPLPSWLGPRVGARAWAVPGETSMRVLVTIAVALLGTLVTYGGSLEPDHPVASRSRLEEEVSA